MANKDIHQQIEDEAAAVHRLTGVQRVTPRDVFPAISDLFDSAAAALSHSIPARFEHMGKTYFLRVSIGMSRLEIFSDSLSAAPLLVMAHGDHDCFGHRPSSDEPRVKH